MTDKANAIRLVTEIERHWKREYLSTHKEAIIRMLMQMPDEIASRVASKASEGKFMPNLERWRECKSAIAPETRERQECETCGGTGTDCVHVLDLSDHSYLGDWTVRATCNCAPVVANCPRMLEDVVRFLKIRRGVDSVAFDSFENLSKWREANAGQCRSKLEMRF